MERDCRKEVHTVVALSNSEGQTAGGTRERQQRQLGNFFPQQIFFCGLGLVLYRKETTRNLTLPNYPHTLVCASFVVEEIELDVRLREGLFSSALCRIGCICLQKRSQQMWGSFMYRSAIWYSYVGETVLLSHRSRHTIRQASALLGTHNNIGRNHSQCCRRGKPQSKRATRLKAG